MTLPTFDGNPEKWLEFRDGFQGLIDANRNLTNIQRMYYLKSVLFKICIIIKIAKGQSGQSYSISRIFRWKLYDRLESPN